MMDLGSLGSRIKELRQEKKLTQSEFAEILNVSFQAVSNWERGIAPPELENLIKVASYFGVLVDDLLRPRTEELYLGIDGGGTKTEFTLVSADGAVVSRFQKKGCNPNDVGFSGMKEIITEGIHEMCVEFPSIKSVFCGIAGIGISNYADRLRQELKLRFSKLVTQAKNDAFNLLAIDDQADMAVISGTGSVVFVKSGDSFTRIGGWGYLLDSAGSAYDIGREALRRALYEEDMAEPPSLLSKKLRERLNVSTVWDHIGTVYKEGRAYVAGLSSVVFDAYSEGDPHAVAIIDESAKALAELLNCGVQKHGVGAVAIANGGLFEHYPQIMRDHIGKYSNVRLILSDLPPVFGACKEACVACGIQTSDQFCENFKKTYGGTKI